MATQAQMLASWRNLLGGARVLMATGKPNEIAMAQRHIGQVQCELLLAQVFGLPSDDEGQAAK